MKSLRTKAADAIAIPWEQIHDDATWLGVTAAKNPTDAWLYQEIIYKVKPNFILETGSFKGGGALFLASMLDICKVDGVVYSIEINPEDPLPEHPKIRWITGNSVDPKIVKLITSASRGKRGLVTLDSAHNTSHVIAEMRSYWKVVAKGSYLIVEDTWHLPGEGGPYDAVEKFLKENHNFEVDKNMHRFAVTNNPRGFLKRK